MPPIKDAIAAQTDSDFKLLTVSKSDEIPTAIKSAKHKYVVILGANCIPQRHFIAAHRKKATQGTTSVSNRILLDQTISQHIIDNCLHPETWNTFELLKLRTSGHIQRLYPRTNLVSTSEFFTFSVYKDEFGRTSISKRLHRRGTVLQLVSNMLPFADNM
jgi:hypothetical protein